MAATAATRNPLREGLRTEHPPEPAILVIFGGSGDLARRKLMPSLYHLAARNLLPESSAVIGFARTESSNDEYRRNMRESLQRFSGAAIDADIWREVAHRLYYVSSDFRDERGYRELSDSLRRLEKEHGTQSNIIFYLATPPSFFPVIIEQLGKVGFAKKSGPSEGWNRIVIEKPFGHDLASARNLNRLVNQVFDERDVYRVDHYLGKETVQNILVLRFANAILEPVWNRGYVDHVQISTAETIGIEGRGDYYEEAGALRDMVQNHCLQLLALVAMEPPAAFEANAVRDEKVKVFRSIRRIPPADVDAYAVRGQYGPGAVGGEQVPGYRQEEEVSPHSTVETYVAARFFVDNWRWQDVPFYVRTGKRLARKRTEIAVRFQRAPHMFFEPTPVGQPPPNTLLIRIQPDEGVSINLETKVPGPTVRLRPVDLAYTYLSAFGVLPTEAYERLLLDCMLGDQTLFARRDGVEAEWGAVTPILEGWQASPPPVFPNYDAGSWGPREANDLIERDGRRWRRI